jgi:hypothetical protein
MHLLVDRHLLPKLYLHANFFWTCFVKRVYCNIVFGQIRMDDLKIRIGSRYKQ